MDYICNQDCPVKSQPPFCCANCVERRKYFINDENRHLWGKNGFWTSQGCALGRDKMPQECKDYDCRKTPFIIRKFWCAKWIEYIEVPLGSGKTIAIVDI